MAALILAVFWLPLTMHCQLELLPGMAFLACCPHHQSPHQDNDCDEDCCAVIESGHYSAQILPVEIPVPLLGAFNYLAEELEFHSFPPESHFPILRSVPPDTPLPWQFVFRAALPPRAPSSVA